ncbi:hypothetical protein FQN49_002122 [Arthroderma sp. PD_2]|nr:hypothetical protein FQN49_002122 [Arthroderma sp. PD_2]
MGRRRLLRAFPLQKLPTRRTRTWCPSKISALGDFGITLASALPPRPQLTRPGRRVDLIYSERAPVVKLEAPTREIDPRQIPLPSIEEEPGSGHEVLKQERSQHHSTEVPPVEPQAEEPPKRARRQAAIACRQRMLERTAPPARRSTRGPAARKKSVASSHEPQASAPNDDGVTAPDAVPKEAEASGNQPEQTGRGRGRSRAPSKAPAKTRAKKAPVKKPPVKKPAPKPKSQPKSQPKGKATAKSKPVSKSGKASAPKKGK